MGADLSTKAQAHADWLANGLSSKEITDKYQTRHDTTLGWIKQWEAQEIREISEKKYFHLSVTKDDVEKHKDHVKTLGSEVERIQKHVETLKVGTPQHSSALKLLIAAGKRYSVLTGIEAIVDKNRAKQVEEGKWEVQQGKLPPSKQPDSPRLVSGPTVPV